MGQLTLLLVPRDRLGDDLCENGVLERPVHADRGRELLRRHALRWNDGHKAERGLQLRQRLDGPQ